MRASLTHSIATQAFGGEISRTGHYWIDISISIAIT